MRFAISVVVLMVAVAATANPIAEELYIDFDPPNHVQTIYPAPYTTFNAYIVADLGYMTLDGVYSVSFDVEVTGGTAQLLDFVPAQPGYIVQGIVGDGIIVIAEECFLTFPVVLGHVPLLYLGAPGFVQIVEHPYRGNVYVTCGDPGEELEYCYTQGGGIDTYPPGPMIYCTNPVEDVAWGAIKALYK